MTKSSFRLQTLFQVRERAKKSAEEALLLAQQEVRLKQQELDQLNGDLSQKIAQRDQRRWQYLEQTTTGFSTVHTIRIQECHLQALKAKEKMLETDIERQKEVVQQTEKKAQERHMEMMNANREFKTVEKLKQSWAVQVRKEIEYKEEEARDEISLAQYVNQRAQE